jgi:histone-binding protein RBBP4
MQTICLWDIDGKTHNSSTVDALSIFTGHDAIVEDVQWHPLHDAIFGSVGDDKKIMLYVIGDVRERVAVVRRGSCSSRT